MQHTQRVSSIKPCLYSVRALRHSHLTHVYIPLTPTILSKLISLALSTEITRKISIFDNTFTPHIQHNQSFSSYLSFKNCFPFPIFIVKNEGFIIVFQQGFFSFAYSSSSSPEPRMSFLHAAPRPPHFFRDYNGGKHRSRPIYSHEMGRRRPRHDKFSPIFVDDRKEAKRFLEAVSGLQMAMKYYVKQSSSSEKLIKAQNIMQTAMKRLEKEFYVILTANRKNLDSESVSARSSYRLSTTSSVSDFLEEDDEASEEEENTAAVPGSTPPRAPSPGEKSKSESDRASDIAMADLKSIADCMIASGYGKECVKIYKLIRKPIIDETLYHLGVEKLNHSQLQKMEWDALEPKIKNWLHAFRVAVKTLFNGERTLCDVVFSSSEIIAASCFTEISRDAALSLFAFPENLVKIKKILSPEKMFRVLDIYEAISELWPAIESIFSHETLSAVRSEATAALVKLREAVEIMLGQFETAIQKDSSKPPTGGGIHPLTRYVMNFLVFLGDYTGALSEILTDSSVTTGSPLPESYFSSPTSGAGEDPAAEAITARVAWLILVLLCKLDGKATLYDDVALAYLFLANNLNYVVSKVRSSSLGLLMGPEWLWKNQGKVNNYRASYERMGWSRVVSSLPEDPTADIPPQEVNQCLTRFQSAFDEAYKKQISWAIPDPKLRDEVKISLAKRIVQVYRVFYQKHRGLDPIVKYAPEDLDNYLSDLFLSASSNTTSRGGSPESSRGH